MIARDRDGNNFPIMEKKNCVGTMTSAPEGLGSIARGGLPPLVSRSRHPQRIMSPGRGDRNRNEPPPCQGGHPFHEPHDQGRFTAPGY